MSFALYSSKDVIALLKDKTIWFCGDSNIRALYKDLVWLVENDTLVADSALKTKNEKSYEGDKRVSSGECTNSTSYEEERAYERSINARFIFLTRINKRCLYKSLCDCKRYPDVMVLNSCVWDVTRWGPESIEVYKKNVPEVMTYLKETLPASTRVIFTTTCPVSNKCRGGFLSEGAQLMRSVLPWHIIEANHYLRECARKREFDVIDLHYHAKLLLDVRAKDGIHWLPEVVRLKTNLILTHVALCEDAALPDGAKISLEFLMRSHFHPVEAEAKLEKKKRRKVVLARRRISTATAATSAPEKEPIRRLSPVKEQR